MKRVATLAVVVAVIGFCLPASGEVLVYKWTSNGYNYNRYGGVGEVEKDREQGYMVFDVTYGEDTIVVNNATLVSYGRDEDGQKTFSADDESGIQVERLPYNGRVHWLAFKYEENQGFSAWAMAGKASNRDIGVEQAREVAASLKGVACGVRHGEQMGGDLMSCVSSNESFTLHAAWTKYANHDDDPETERVEGLAGSFNATLDYVKQYLAARGYTEEIE